MARITKGILGGFSGKVGTIVGANWRGKDIIRSTPKPSSRPPTGKQLQQQMKFKLVISFLQPLKSIQTRYFGSASGVKSRLNMATSYTINEAVEVVADLPELIFNKVLITKGDLAGFQNPVATPQAAQVIQLSWEDNSNQGNATATDKANAICYCKELGTFEFFEVFADRNGLTATITLPSYYSGKDIQLWMYFTNIEEKLACNSPYLGVITVL